MAADHPPHYPGRPVGRCDAEDEARDLADEPAVVRGEGASEAGALRPEQVAAVAALLRHKGFVRAEKPTNAAVRRDGLPVWKSWKG